MSSLIKLDLNPGRATLRSFGFVALGGFGALALCAWQRWLMFSGLGASGSTVGLVLAALGAGSALLSLVAPQANRALYVTMSALGYQIGLVMSQVVLAALYFGLFAPIAVLFRLVGRDPLERRLDGSAKSYWSRYSGVRGKEQYFRQY